MKKMLFIFGSIVLVLAIIGGGLFWWFSNQPLYKPGMVRDGKDLRAPLTPPEKTGEEGFWTVEEDIQLHHFATGEGRNVLVIHGGPGYPYTEPWPGLETLTRAYRIHFYDQRGCGQSTRPIDTFTSKNFYENMQALDQALGLGAQVADIERIRRLLGEEKLILVGHSFGGFLASLYAAEFPEHVEGMVLLAPANVLVMPQKEGSSIFDEVGARLPKEMREEYEAFVSEYLNFQDIFSKSEADLVAMNEKLGEYYATAIDVEAPQQGETGGWGVQAIYLSMGKRHDYSDSLQAVESPVLVIHGAEDAFQAKSASRLYAEAFPQGEFRLVEGGGHFLFLNQPEVFEEVLGEFLAGLD